MNGPKIVLSSPYRGGFGLERTHERPAGEPPAEALAGRNGTGAPGRFGGAVIGERPCHPTPQASEGGWQ